MPFRVFQVPVRNSTPFEDQLNRFLASHSVLHVDRRFIDSGDNSSWVFCVDYVEPRESAAPRPEQASPRGRVDYRERLNTDQFAVFSQLREWRKRRAQSEGVPVYTLFTNEQLAQIVLANVESKAALETVVGVGDARISKYGAELLHALGVPGEVSNAPPG
jgi:superfamily II DNA helicase RecQ